jgi:ferritin
MARFPGALNEQIAYEFAASQQYVAIAAHYDAETLPQLAATFYRQAVEERNHAMIGEQFLHWFLQEQREEVASMSELLRIVERAGDNVLLVEEYLARTGAEESPLEAGAPPAAGGAL